jgi:hypothetical protein
MVVCRNNRVIKLSQIALRKFPIELLRVDTSQTACECFSELATFLYDLWRRQPLEAIATFRSIADSELIIAEIIGKL